MPTMSVSAPVPALGGTFALASGHPPRRLVIALDGVEKQGKSHFAFTAPGPIAYQSFDVGDEGVVEKFQGSKVIYRATYDTLIDKGMDQKAIMAKIEPVWDRFIDDYKIALAKAKSGAVRTLVIDTGSEAWEVLRLARFGKLTQIMPHHYTALNTEYRNLIREIYNTPANLVILHKLKAEWVDNPATGKGNKTGGYERAGFADTGFLVQVNALAYRERLQGDPKGAATGPFHILVKDCRQNAAAAGEDLQDGNFQQLALMVYPESDFSDWE